MLLIVKAAVIAIFVAGLRDDPGPLDGNAALSADNSHIVMHSKRINGVVATGLAALGPLINEMGRSDTSLDTFTRCYSACDQILCKAGLKESVRWHGGLIDSQNGRVVGIARTDGDSATFRQEQIAEIVQCAKEVGILVGGK